MTANAPAYDQEMIWTGNALTDTVRRNGATRFFLILPLIGGIFLSRFALPLSGRQLPVPLLVILASVVGVAAFGKLRAHLPRMVLFCLSIAAMMVATVLDAGRVSPMSFLLFAVLYLTYAFVINGDEFTHAWVIAAFRRICLIVAVTGIVQCVAQVVLPGPTLFTFRGVIPDQYLALEYNYVGPSDFLPRFRKSNGFFLPEPSLGNAARAA